MAHIGHIYVHYLYKLWCYYYAQVLQQYYYAQVLQQYYYAQVLQQYYYAQVLQQYYNYTIYSTSQLFKDLHYVFCWYSRLNNYILLNYFTDEELQDSCIIRPQATGTGSKTRCGCPGALYTLLITCTATVHLLITRVHMQSALYYAMLCLHPPPPPPHTHTYPPH